MDTELLKKLKAGISDLLIRYPLYRFRKGQADEYRLRVLLVRLPFPEAVKRIPDQQIADARFQFF